jgi:hypothetical protein
MGESGYQDDSLSVGECGAGEATDGAIEKFWVLVELDDVVAWASFLDDLMPRLTRVSMKVTLQNFAPY